MWKSDRGEKIDQFFTLLFFPPIIIISHRYHISHVSRHARHFLFSIMFTIICVCVCVLWPLKMKINLFHIHSFFVVVERKYKSSLYKQIIFSKQNENFFSHIFFRFGCCQLFFLSKISIKFIYLLIILIF